MGIRLTFPWLGKRRSTKEILPSEKQPKLNKPTALDKIAAKLYLRWKSRKLKP